MGRTYELKRRAERMAETRRRIVEAAVELHTTVGPARTSIAALAQRAGVQRHTVYAHFPDTRALLAACSMHWDQANPFPDPAPWAAIGDPEDRLRTALTELYRWYEGVEDALALFRRDASVLPESRELEERRKARYAQLADLLAGGLGAAHARAAVGHALGFETWRSLVRGQGLSPDAAVELMVRLASRD